MHADEQQRGQKRKLRTQVSVLGVIPFLDVMVEPFGSAAAQGRGGNAAVDGNVVVGRSRIVLLEFDAPVRSSRRGRPAKRSTRRTAGHPDDDRWAPMRELHGQVAFGAPAGIFFIASRLDQGQNLRFDLFELLTAGTAHVEFHLAVRRNGVDGSCRRQSYRR